MLDYGNIKQFKLIKEKLPENIAWDYLKVVLAYLQVRQHLKNVGIPYEEFEDVEFDDLNLEIPQTQIAKETVTEIANNQNDSNGLSDSLDNDEVDDLMVALFDEFDDVTREMTVAPDDNTVKIDSPSKKQEIDSQATIEHNYFDEEPPSKRGKIDDLMDDILASPPRSNSPVTVQNGGPELGENNLEIPAWIFIRDM